jgi:hypothetical protein
LPNPSCEISASLVRTSSVLLSNSASSQIICAIPVRHRLWHYESSASPNTCAPHQKRSTRTTRIAQSGRLDTTTFCVIHIPQRESRIWARPKPGTERRRAVCRSGSSIAHWSGYWRWPAQGISFLHCVVSISSDVGFVGWH